MGSHCDYGIFISTYPWRLFLQGIIVVLIMGVKLNMYYSFYLHSEVEVSDEFNL